MKRKEKRKAKKEKKRKLNEMPSFIEDDESIPVVQTPALVEKETIGLVKTPSFLKKEEQPIAEKVAISQEAVEPLPLTEAPQIPKTEELSPPLVEQPPPPIVEQSPASKLDGATEKALKSEMADFLEDMKKKMRGDDD